MTPIQIIFLLVAVLTLASGLMVVTCRKMLHAALWLVLSLFGIAMLFAILEAGFFAVVQVVVYIGAIAILIIFAVMLTRRVMEDTGPQVNRYWPVAAVAVVGIFAGLVAIFRGWGGMNALPPEYTQQAHSQTITQLGQALVSPTGYVLPFEASSVLLLGALVGAIFIAWEKK